MEKVYYIKYVNMNDSNLETKTICAKFENFPMLSEIEEAIRLVDKEVKGNRIGIELITTIPY